MTQVEDQASQAEERSQEIRSFGRQVRAATRRKYTPEEKIRIVLEGFRRETTVNDLCRREGIKPHSYYAWTKWNNRRSWLRWSDMVEGRTGDSGSLAFPGARIIGGGGGTGRAVGRVRKELRGPGIACVQKRRQ